MRPHKGNYMDGKTALIKARAKFSEFGMSSTARGRQKLAVSCVWIYRHGYTSPDLLNRLVTNSGHSGIVRKLEREGLVVKTYMEGGGLIRGVPRHVLTLTTAGVALAETMVSVALDYEQNPSRVVRRDTLRHDMLVQFLTYQALARGGISGYRSERELMALNAEDVAARVSSYSVKVPDALWEYADGTATAVELELSPKWGRKFDDFRLGLFSGMRSGRWHGANIFMESPANHIRYIAGFADGVRVPRWVLSPSRHWIQSGSPHAVTAAESRAVSVLLLDGGPGGHFA